MMPISKYIRSEYNGSLWIYDYVNCIESKAAVFRKFSAPIIAHAKGGVTMSHILAMQYFQLTLHI